MNLQQLSIHARKHEIRDYRVQETERQRRRIKARREGLCRKQKRDYERNPVWAAADIFLIPVILSGIAVPVMTGLSFSLLTSITVGILSTFGWWFRDEISDRGLYLWKRWQIFRMKAPHNLPTAVEAYYIAKIERLKVAVLGDKSKYAKTRIRLDAAFARNIALINELKDRTQHTKRPTLERALNVAEETRSQHWKLRRKIETFREQVETFLEQTTQYVLAMRGQLEDVDLIERVHAEAAAVGAIEDEVGNTIAATLFALETNMNQLSVQLSRRFEEAGIRNAVLASDLSSDPRDELEILDRLVDCFVQEMPELPKLERSL